MLEFALDRKWSVPPVALRSTYAFCPGRVKFAAVEALLDPTIAVDSVGQTNPLVVPEETKSGKVTIPRFPIRSRISFFASFPLIPFGE